MHIEKTQKYSKNEIKKKHNRHQHNTEMMVGKQWVKS